MASDWANLNTDLIQAIAKRLRIQDYIRLQAVCKAWLSTLRESTFRLQPRHQIPWLALPNGNSNTCRLYSLTDKKLHHIELPELRGRRCCGTAHGWMAMVDNSANVSLLNPLTRSQISLPSITTFPEISQIGKGKYYYPNEIGQVEIQTGEFLKKSFFYRIIPSGDPSLTKDYVVMAIYGIMMNLAFCKEGDDRWTLLEHEKGDCFDDVVYWKGNFYATNRIGHLSVVCDFAGPLPMEKRILIQRPSIGGGRKFLVPSGNELLLVSRKIKFYSRDINDISSWTLDDIDEYGIGIDHGDNYDDEEEVYVNANYEDDHDVVDENSNYEDNDDYDNSRESDNKEDEVDENSDDEDDDDERESQSCEEVHDNTYYEDDDDTVVLYKTQEFEVFKLDEERLVWVKVTSIDDCILFVGYNFGLSLSANDFPECKADHIYFTDNMINPWDQHIVGGHDLGAYNLKNGEIETFPCCPESTWLIWPPPYWVTLSPH